MKRLLKTIMALIVIIPILMIMADFLRFPECYLPTWKYQLKNDIAAGDEVAIEYYETRYVANGKILFE